MRPVRRTLLLAALLLSLTPPLHAQTTTDPSGHWEGTISAPFGEVLIEVGREMEGIWNGTLDVDGVQLRLVLKMSNQPDGTSTGSIVSIDQGGIEVPVAIIQKAANLTLDVKMTRGSYSGALNAAGTELVGTYTQGSLAVPLSFRYAAAEGKK